MSSFSRKIRKNQKQKDSSLTNMAAASAKIMGFEASSKKDIVSNIFESFLGSADNPQFPYSVKHERIRDLKLSEDELLKKFGKSYFEESFSNLKKYILLHKKYKSTTYLKDNYVDIDLVKICLDENELLSFFKMQNTYARDRLNYIADMLEYSKNKKYEKFYKLITTTFNSYFDKEFLDTYVESILSFGDLTLLLRFLQQYFVDAAPYVAFENKLEVKTYEDCLKAITKYNEQNKNYNKGTLAKILNPLSNLQYENDEVSKLRVNKITSSFFKFESNIKNEYTEEELMSAIKEKSDTAVYKSFLNEDGTFNYSKAVEYSKSSRDSVQKILKSEKAIIEEVIALIVQFFKVKIKQLLESKIDRQKVEELFAESVELIKENVKPFYYYCFKEKIDFSDKKDFANINSLFVKKQFKIYS